VPVTGLPAGEPGLTRHLRTRFAASACLGIEIEANRARLADAAAPLAEPSDAGRRVE
jgi:hypothetical protein